MSQKEAPVVAVLGTGAMGRGIASRLAQTGHTVRAWNRTPANAQLDEVGITLCATPAAAAGDAAHVLLVLADDAAVEEVMSGLAGHLTADQLVLNLGTVSAGLIRRLASSAPIADVGMLGNANHARTGDLRLYLGCDPAQVERAQEVLTHLAKEVRHVGPLGTGMNLKLALNLLMGLEMQALAEVITLGETLGIDRRDLLDTVRGSGFSAPVMGFKSLRMASGRYSAPDFRLGLMAKDLQLAVQTADRALPMATAACQAHLDACAAGWADYDCAAIADALTRYPAPAPASSRAGG
jgi:3-hydroxyisobutyrate dehydrogenase